MKYRQSRLAAGIQHGWMHNTTMAGKITAASILLTAVVAMVSLEIPVYQLLIALCMFVFVAFGASWLARPCIEVLWRLPEKAVAGQDLDIVCHASNRSRFWARAIGVSVAPVPAYLCVTRESPALDGIEPAKGAELALHLQAPKRGFYPWPAFRVFTLFPFGLFRMPVRGARRARHAFAPASLIVYPHFRRLVAIDVPINARYQPGGIALSSSVGESPEYIGNREYRPGDSTRHLDHRSWARLAMPAVKEYQEEYYCRVALVLDTFIAGRQKPGPGGYPPLEAAVSLSAAIADVLARGEYILDLFAAGPELYVFRAGRSTAHFENVLEILACVGACHANPFRKITPSLVDELANISSVICVFLDWDDERAQLVRAAAEAGCSVKVLIVRDGPTTRPYASMGTMGSIAQYAPETIRAGRVEAL